MRKKIGDIIEIKTKKGVAYGQYTHESPDHMGSVLRFFQGLYQDNLSSEDIVSLPLRFTILFPLGAALHRKLINRIDNKPVRADLQEFPIFRIRLLKYMSDSNPKEWGVWNGKDLNNFDIIESSLLICKTFPEVRSWSMPDLVERLESDNNDEFYN